MNWPFWSLSRPSSTETCDSIDPLLSLYADGMASPDETRRVDTHLPDCETCRESLAWVRATQQTLAARPIMTPPASLHSRIAFAIAASSAAPSLRPARSFSLRPVTYAAAASVVILGLVSYSLRQTPAHVAAVPPSLSIPLAMPAQTATVPAVKTFGKPNGRHLVLKIQPRPLVANNVPAATSRSVVSSHAETAPPPVTHTHLALNPPPVTAPLTHLIVPAVKVRLHAAPSTQMASHERIPPGTHLPVPVVNTITPEPQKTADNAQSPVPVRILPPVDTVDPARKTVVASTGTPSKSGGILDTVTAHLPEINSGGMHAASYVISHQSYSGTANDMHMIDNEHHAYQGMIYTP